MGISSPFLTMVFNPDDDELAEDEPESGGEGTIGA